MTRPAIMFAAVAMASLALEAATAQPISIRSSFRIGGGGSVLCLAQAMGTDPSLTDMFDRGFSIVCRDATAPIGMVHALRVRDSDPAVRLAAIRSQRATCRPATPGQVEGIGAVETFDCQLNDNPDVGYRAYQLRRGKWLYSAEGLAGYDSALTIALRSVVTDKPAPGEVSVAITGAGDPAAFARVQAGTLDRSRALAEAYRRNNAGNYAESAEFFASVTSGEMGRSAQAEALVNEALQKSNLGRYPEADALLARAADLLGNDPLVARQLRNYRAMHLLNQGLAEDALAVLDEPLPEAAQLPAPAIARLVIDAPTATRLNSETSASGQLGSGSAALQLREKVQILDAQVHQLRGPALRLTGDIAGAAAELAKADAALAAVRGGRLSSIVWMRAQILSDLGAVAEASGKPAEAEEYYHSGVKILEVDYPDSAVLHSARGRLAAYLARSGQVQAATELFRMIVKANANNGNSPPALARLLVPYAELLLKNGSDQQSAADLFEAAQAMVRPGVAQTQAVLARELSGGSDEAARLFRQSVTLTRQIGRSRTELARLELAQQPTPGEVNRKSTLRASIAEYEQDQIATQAGLAAFPRFRAVTAGTLPLAELKQLLRPGEAYYKMTVIDHLLFALFVTPDGARAVRIDATANELDDQVNQLRRTIAVASGGQTLTYPFDAALAHQLYGLLFGKLENELAGVRHLIFEPDGAMLRLPLNLLVRNKAGVDAYLARAAASPDAEFDFTGLQWLGRDVDISTSVSARSFSDVRSTPRATAAREYLGLGENSRPPAAPGPAGIAPEGSELDCTLAIGAWDRPISPRELRIARDLLAGGDSRRAQLITRDAFTDTALKGRSDLRDYRIIHFATHGIVTAPKPRCPAQPALMTSFGGEGSDGLLTFREIFDLRLDADLIILSACDTAGTASASATSDAGLGSGGEQALDGLVRAFVGAGGRLVVASHWPVPDDFSATQRLMTGLFSASPGVPTVAALRASQRKLMDDPATSHPFYWSAFSVIGDGTAPVRRDVPKIASAER